MKMCLDKTNPYIQFCITRSCNLRCSNCTQLLSLRSQKSDPVHMSLEVFEQALIATADWPRKFSIFGGNPATHPEFEELLRIFIRRVPDQRQRAIFCNDPMDHADAIRRAFAPHGDINFNVHYDSEAAMKIRETGMGQWIVGHSYDRSSYHTPILVDRRDVGVSEADWIEKRESCQFNAEWSAAVYERNGKPVVYFCEIAGAIDAMTGADHSLPCVPGWWRQKIDAFAGQVSGCCDAGCGVPLKMLGSVDHDEAIDYSAKWSPQVELTIGKRRMKTSVLHADTGRTTQSVTDYLSLRTEDKLNV